MKISILTLGTRGDVQPYMALGLGLQHAGHSVRLITDAGFDQFVQDYGLEFAPLQADFIQLAQSSEGKAAMAGKGRLALMKKVMPMLRRLMDDAWLASQGSDIIIFHTKVLAGIHIAERLNVPGFLAMALPTNSSTKEYASPMIASNDYGALLNKLSHLFFTKMSLLPFRKIINSFRRDTLGLPSFKDDTTLHGKPVTKLYAYSQYVSPRPADWGPDAHITGYWFLPAQNKWQPSRELSAFLDTGSPPIYIGFGSVATQDSEAKSKIVLDAVKLSRQRAILVTGWGGLSATHVPEQVFVLDSAPHDWLFPRCSAVVHHGGAGTTAAGLQAGKPTIIVPFFGDQPFWGQRVAMLGVGPKPIPQKKLCVQNLAEAIQQVTNRTDMRNRAETLGTMIRAEDGVANAVNIILNHKKQSN